MKASTLSLPIPSHPSHDVLDSTKIQTYQDCPRLFFYEYLLGWRNGRPNNHLHFGSAVHVALEHIILNGYRVESAMEALELFNTEYRAFFPEETDSMFLPKTPARFFDMMTRYLVKYKDDLIRYEVYKTEFGGTIHLSPEHDLAFKMDTILFDRQLKKYVSLEHKTKGGNYIGDNYMYEHMMGIQCGTYTHVLNCLFSPEDVGEVIINCLCMKKTKQPDYILQRFPVYYTNAQMFNWIENVKQWMDRIFADLYQLSLTSPTNEHMTCFPMNGRSCTNWGRTCTFIDLCTGWLNPLKHLHQMPIDFKVEFWNPLEEDLREVLEL